MRATDTHRAIDAVWRIESARLIAGLARLVRDVGLAEEMAQDALVAALEQWPERGVPDNPAAWLMATAKHRAIDRIRRRDLQARKEEELAAELQARGEDVQPDFVDALADAQNHTADDRQHLGRLFDLDAGARIGAHDAHGLPDRKSTRLNSITS